jgi:hypothetical protein
MFNILPEVGQNKLNEVYVVGQLHIDVFEKTEFPDMALSNRQGYKTDDPRYIKAIGYIRNTLLRDILSKRQKFVSLKNKDKDKAKEKLKKNDEEKLGYEVEKFKKNASQEIAQKLNERAPTLSVGAVEEVANAAINKFVPDLGLKQKIDSQKKKILISQTWKDKPLSDTVYEMLLFNGVPKNDILYTNSDDHDENGIPYGEEVYDYLRDFFVESYSTQKIAVIFITSKNMGSSWGAIVEVGAAWITKMGHDVFNIPPFSPEPPLNNRVEWQTSQISGQQVTRYKRDAAVFCQKIEQLCSRLGYSVKPRADNLVKLGELATILDS